jgi:catechol 2,3-dioxygenase-like lactoylglutathione lyase family enzyme
MAALAATAAPVAPVAPPAAEPAVPALRGVSHVALSVPDVAAATDFWTTVLGFEAMGGGSGYCLLLHRTARVAVAVAHHGGTVRGAFDEHHPGLDHLALAVSDLETLRAWERWLADRRVPYTPITASDSAHHLNVRAPGDIPVELCVLDPAFLAALGVDGPAAGTH